MEWSGNLPSHGHIPGSGVGVVPEDSWTWPCLTQVSPCIVCGLVSNLSLLLLFFPPQLWTGAPAQRQVPALLKPKTSALLGSPSKHRPRNGPTYKGTQDSFIGLAGGSKGHGSSSEKLHSDPASQGLTAKKIKRNI